MEATKVTKTEHPRFCQLMHRLQQWKDASEGEITKYRWTALFRDLDLNPRAKFLTNVCDQCLGDIIAMPTDDNLPPCEIKTVSDRLLLLFHDGACLCVDVTKKQVSITLLELVAACGHMLALKACISRMQNMDRRGRSTDRLVRKLTIRKSRSNSDQKRAATGSLNADSRGTKQSESFYDKNSGDSLQEGYETNISIAGEVEYDEEVETASSSCVLDMPTFFRSRADILSRSEHRETPSMSYLETNSDSQKDILDTLPHGYATSEECAVSWFHEQDKDGVHNFSTLNSSLLMPVEGRSDQVKSDDYVEQAGHFRSASGNIGKTDRSPDNVPDNVSRSLSADPCEFPIRHADIRSSRSNNYSTVDGAFPVENVAATGFDDFDEVSRVQTFHKISRSFTAEACECSIPHSDHCGLNEPTGLQTLHHIFCKYKAEENERVDPPEELYPADVHALKCHVDQASLLSMCLHAVYHNSPAMMICALALNTDNMAQLVRFCSALPSSESVLRLYHLSVGSTEHFQNVPKGDLQTLEERTLREEHAQLCRIAWQDMDGKMGRAVQVSRLQSFIVDICAECCRTLFPESNHTGKTIYIKFHRHLQDNGAIFDCIRAGKCPCDLDSQTPQKRVRRITLLPACAAAVSGNIRMLELLTRDWSSLSQECRPRKPNPLNTPSKSCLKSSPYWHTHHVTFKAEAETQDESDVGDVLLHTLCGGSDDCFHYMLQNMNAVSLTPRVVLNCLVMALRVGRDDLFLETACKFGLNVNSLEEDASTPLMLAAMYERPLLVSVLLSLGADPCAPNAIGETAADYAICSAGAEFLAQRLLSATPDEKLDELHMTQALRNQKLQVVQYLFSRGITTVKDTTSLIRNFYPYPPVDQAERIPLTHWVMRNIWGKFSDKDLAAVEFFLSKSPDAISPISSSLLTPLHLHLRHGCCSSKVVDLLVKYGVSVNARTSSGETALYIAICHNMTDVLGPLIRLGASLYASVDASTRSPSSTLIQALGKHLYNIVLFLMHAGYRCSAEEVKHLEQAADASGDWTTWTRISSVRCQPLSLAILCAGSLRESLQDDLNSYLQTIQCPQIVRRFIRLEHLIDEFLPPLSGST